MRSDRREFFKATLSGVGIASAGSAVTARSQNATEGLLGAAGGPPVPVISPDVPTLLPSIEDGVKVFHLVAEPVKTEFLRVARSTAGASTAVCPVRPSR